MKIIIVFILLFSSLAIVYAQDFFMYVGGEKRHFEISSNKMLVQFVENTETSTVKSIMGKNMSFQVSDISKTAKCIAISCNNINIRFILSFI